MASLPARGVGITEDRETQSGEKREPQNTGRPGQMWWLAEFFFSLRYFKYINEFTIQFVHLLFLATLWPLYHSKVNSAQGETLERRKLTSEVTSVYFGASEQQLNYQQGRRHIYTSGPKMGLESTGISSICIRVQQPKGWKFEWKTN